MGEPARIEGTLADDDANAIRRFEAECVEVFKSRDLERLGRCYTEDAALFIPDKPLITDHQAILEAWKPLLEDANFALDFELTRVEVARSADLGYCQGHYVLRFTDPATKRVMAQKGKYVTVFKKNRAGEWRVAADIFNQDAAAAPAP